MDYTDEQYALMEKLERGIIYCMLSDGEKRILRYLDGQKIAQPNVCLEDGYYSLSEYGKRALSAHRKILDEKRERESIRQENERKENGKQQAAEQKENERFNREQSCKEAERKAEHAFQYKLSFLNAFLTFISGLISGAILSNLDRIILWVVSLISWH